MLQNLSHSEFIAYAALIVSTAGFLISLFFGLERIQHNRAAVRAWPYMPMLHDNAALRLRFTNRGSSPLILGTLQFEIDGEIRPYSSIGDFISYEMPAVDFDDWTELLPGRPIKDGEEIVVLFLALREESPEKFWHQTNNVRKVLEKTKIRLTYRIAGGLGSLVYERNLADYYAKKAERNQRIERAMAGELDQ